MKSKTKSTDRPLNQRPTGAEGKAHVSAKENIQAVFVRLGSTAAMAEWARENLTEFYKIYARLVPTDVRHANPNGTPLNFMMTVPPKADGSLGPQP